MKTKTREWILGNEPVRERLNIRQELAGFRAPLFTLLILRIDPDALAYLNRSNAARCAEALSLYYLCLERYLTYASVALRWERGPRRKIGERLTPRERELSKRYRALSRYMILDFYDCLIHARILCDRVASLAHYFLDEGQRPSFTSFADHKKFFWRLRSPYGKHESYAAYIRENTDWFDMPLKLVRDKFLVHAGPRHMRFFGYDGNSPQDLTMLIRIPVARLASGATANQMISVSIRRLARDINAFLEWFAGYALTCMGLAPNSAAPADHKASLYGR
jgi:hypothetical protein